MIAGQPGDFVLSIVSTSGIRSIDPRRLLPSLLGLFQRQVPGSRLVLLGIARFGSLSVSLSLLVGVVCYIL